MGLIIVSQTGFAARRHCADIVVTCQLTVELTDRLIRTRVDDSYTDAIAGTSLGRGARGPGQLRYGIAANGKRALGKTQAEREPEEAKGTELQHRLPRRQHRPEGRRLPERSEALH